MHGDSGPGTKEKSSPTTQGFGRALFNKLAFKTKGEDSSTPSNPEAAKVGSLP